MFGPKLRIVYDGLGVSLVPGKLEWAAYYAEMMSSLKVNMWTNGMYGLTEVNEREWLERQSADKFGVSWAIMPDGCELPVGNTGLHGVDAITRTCSSGIIIFDPAWWGKGVASRAHLIRTWFAADMLNRLTIQSTVRCENDASRKALERVGYTATGTIPRNCYRNGVYVDTYTLAWINPSGVTILYPDGLPEMYREGVGKAEIALNKAHQFIQVL